jgi:methionyl-tRNA formyltransferase
MPNRIFVNVVILPGGRLPTRKTEDDAGWDLYAVEPVVIDQVEYDIQPQDRRPDLEKKLTNLGYDLFKNQILNSAGRLIQNDKDATYTRRLTRQDGFIPLSVLKKALQNEPLTSHELPSLIQDFMQKNNLDQLEQLDIRNSSKIIFDYFRGLFPWPGLWTLVPIEGVEKRLKITDISLSNLLTTNYQLLINKVQLEGKTEVSFEQFTKSYPALKL